MVDAMHAWRDDDCRERPFKHGRQGEVHVGPHVKDWAEHAVGRRCPGWQAQQCQHNAADGSVDKCLTGVVAQAGCEVYLFVGVVNGMEAPKRMEVLQAVQGIREGIKQKQTYGQDQPRTGMLAQDGKRPAAPAAEQQTGEAMRREQGNAAENCAKQAEIRYPPQSGGGATVSRAARLHCREHNKRG